MKLQDLKVDQLLRFIGRDPIGVFACAHIWKVMAIEDGRVSLSDMKGTLIKSHSTQLLRDFEEFIPTDAPVIDWKTKYLGVVK